MRKLLELTINNLFVRLLVTGMIVGIPAAITTSWLGAGYLTAIRQVPFLPTVLGLFLSGTIPTFATGISIMYMAERWLIKDRAINSWRWVVIRILLNMLTGIPMSVATFISISLVMGRNPLSVESIYPLQAILQSGVVGAVYTLVERATFEIRKREAQYKSQIEQLTVEIDLIKRDRQVNEVVDSDYFKKVKLRAEELRNRKKGSEEVLESRTTAALNKTEL